MRTLPAVKKTAIAALAAAIFLAAAQGAAAAPHTAYFKVSLLATQDVTWTKQLTYRTNCGSGTLQLEGKSDSALDIRTPHAQPAVAQRLGNGRIALRFRGGGALLPVVGTLTRHGVSYATGQTPETTAGCPKPGPPVDSDCGTRHFGVHSTIGVGYYTPPEWPYESGPVPLTDAIALTGPSVPDGAGSSSSGAQARTATTSCAVRSTSPKARTAAPDSSRPSCCSARTATSR